MQKSSFIVYILTILFTIITIVAQPSLEEYMVLYEPKNSAESKVFSKFVQIIKNVFNSNNDSADLLQKSEGISSVEPNNELVVNSVKNASSNMRSQYSPKTWIAQDFAPWQLSKTSSVNGKPINFYPYGVEYYLPKPQNDVVVYVIDSGIDDTVEEFEGRVIHGKNFITNEPNTDLIGHGTSIAATIAGKLNGPIKHAKIVSIKVLNTNNTGKLYDFVESLNWAVDHKKKNFDSIPGIINFSINLVMYSKNLNYAFKKVFDNGMLTVASAGNQAKDACDFSPSGSEYVITTASYTPQNIFDKDYSNYGKCVDILAPGVNVVSAKVNQPGQINDVRPYVELKDLILKTAIKNQIAETPENTPNARLWNGYRGSTSKVKFI
ncbi:hypothetical protein BB561_005650 [Smittium simulii]|uniref:Peptidase S8/S53 domain-containing protein n=1 Tax=Smittium simulii TaxID=133385 RepID=A0A2T9Y993_9FUNG|nr:hypothetical protein BB561_005650 [Smittium simulii]